MAPTVAAAVKRDVGCNTTAAAAVAHRTCGTNTAAPALRRSCGTSTGDQPRLYTTAELQAAIDHTVAQQARQQAAAQQQQQQHKMRHGGTQTTAAPPMRSQATSCRPAQRTVASGADGPMVPPAAAAATQMSQSLTGPPAGPEAQPMAAAISLRSLLAMGRSATGVEADGAAAGRLLPTSVAVQCDRGAAEERQQQRRATMRTQGTQMAELRTQAVATQVRQPESADILMLIHNHQLV